MISGWWFGTFFLFSIIYGIILPIDSYFSRWLKPPTRYDILPILNSWCGFWVTSPCYQVNPPMNFGPLVLLKATVSGLRTSFFFCNPKLLIYCFC